MKLLNLAALLIMLTVSSANAKVFRNAYISFEMPENWNCNLEQTEWVCRSEQTKESKEAIIILTAKEVGPTDSNELYESHLNQPMSVQLRGGDVAQSKVQYKSKNVSINDQMWVDGLHLGSEVPNYFTRYLATIKERIAILITFSAHKDYYTKYSADFFKAVQSLRVIAAKNLLAGRDSGIRPGSETLGSSIGSAMPGDMEGMDQMGAKKKGGLNIKIFGLAILLAAIGIFLIIKRRKK